MMMEIMYLIPLAAWLTFVYVQYHWGDRPTTHVWFSLMAGIGTFECTKGVFALATGMPATEMAFGAGLFAAACVQVARVRASREREELLRADAVLAAGH